MVCRMAPIATDGAAAFIGEPSMPKVYTACRGADAAAQIGRQRLRG